MTPAAQPRPGIRDAVPYASPQVEVRARLNTNESPMPLPPGFADELAESVRELSLNRYPDGNMTDLRGQLAAHQGHPYDGTWTANGSNEIISELLLAYGGPGRRAVVFEPTYLLHARLAWITHTDLTRLYVDPPFELTTADVDRALAAEPDVVFVCSPNNPTGTARPIEATAELAERTTGLVIVDEAYIEFGGESAVKLTAHHPNIAVVRTFSKAFALAGARLGYVLTDHKVVEDLERVRLPYHLSSLAQAAGIAALHHAEDAQAIIAGIRTQRDRILRELAAIDGVTVFPSDANFVLFVPTRPAGDVWQALLDRGALVRDLSTVVPNALRVTAGTEAEIDLFLAALQEVLAA